MKSQMRCNITATTLFVLGLVLRIIPQEQGVPRAIEDPESYAVYASLLPTEWPIRVARARTLVLQKETTFYSRCLPSGGVLETDWRPILESFKAANAVPAVILEGHELGVPYVVRSSTEIRAILREEPSDGTFGWRAFYRRYPDSGGFVQVSAVGFDDVKRRALLYMGHSCGGLCGGGTYHFLERSSGAWREVKLNGVANCAWAS